MQAPPSERTTGTVTDARLQRLLRDLQLAPSPDWWVALEELVRIGGPAVQGLAALLLSPGRDEEAEEREPSAVRASEALVRIGRAAVPSLIALLTAGGPAVGREAAEALGRIGDPSAAAPLLQALKEWDTALFVEAQRALIRIGSPAVPQVWAALGHPNRRVRIGAARVLAEVRDSRSTEALCRALRDDDAFIRTLAAEALGEIGGGECVAALCEAVGNGNRQAAAALGKIGDPAAVPPLCAALASDDRYLARRAATALGMLADPRAIASLVEALGRWSPEECVPAAEAIGRIAAAAPVPELAAAVPPLRRLLSPWSLASPEARLSFRDALRRIEGSACIWIDLPRPAAARALTGQPYPLASRLPSEAPSALSVHPVSFEAASASGEHSVRNVPIGRHPGQRPQLLHVCLALLRSLALRLRAGVDHGRDGGPRPQKR